MQMFRRRHHQLIAKILANLDSRFLSRTHCYFGGGTQVVLTLGEYRESRDIDFLCADGNGYRLLRESVTNESLGKILRKPIALAREVRSDRDGIRTFFCIGGAHIKFEIVREARIELQGRFNSRLRVPMLNRECAIAEKFLANADRVFDRSTHMRDLIDLSFLAAHSDQKVLTAGFRRAQSSYGNVVRNSIAAALGGIDGDESVLSESAKVLGVADTQTVLAGLQKLQLLLNRVAD